MNEMLSEIVEIEQLLSNIDSGDLYEIGIGFFSILGYPVNRKSLSKNVNIISFLENLSERKVNFNPYERLYLQSIKSISHLFSISATDLGCSKKTIKNYSKLNLIAIDCNGLKQDRSLNAFALTKILSKAFTNPTFFFMHHEGCIILTTQVYNNPGDESSGKIFLSEWYNCYYENYHKMYELTGFSFFNHSIQSIAALHLDMTYSISRNYLIWQESFEYLFGYYFDPSLFYMLDRYTSIKEYIYNLRCNSYKNIYGHDYIEKEWIEILEPEENDYFDDEYCMEAYKDELIEDDDFEENEFDESDDEFDSLSEEDLDDPVRLLEYLDENEGDD